MEQKREGLSEKKTNADVSTTGAAAAGVPGADGWLSSIVQAGVAAATGVASAFAVAAFRFEAPLLDMRCKMRFSIKQLRGLGFSFKRLVSVCLGLALA